MTKKILLLGSGELGKEFVIAAKRKGQYVIACDSYAGAPAMQVADEFEVFSMLDGDALDAVHFLSNYLDYYRWCSYSLLYSCQKKAITDGKESVKFKK